MIKLVFVSSSTNGGGAERMQLNIMHSLSKEKYDITFINTSSDHKPSDLKDHIKYVQYNKPHARQSFCKLLYDLSRMKPDYVFTTSIVVAYLLIIVRLFSFSKFRLYVRIAVPPSESPKNNFKSRVLRKVNSLVLKYSELIIAQTEFSKKDIAKLYKVPLKKIQVIRNIIDKTLLDINGNCYIPTELIKENYNIVASGALYSVKGFDLLIDAMKLVVNKKSKVKLYVLGEERYEFGYKKFLLKKINENGLQDSVFLLGHKTNPFPYYKHSDLFVMSSRTEGFPNVVLEALYYGTPVVATNCVDFSGVIINDMNGYIVEKESHIAIAEGIEKAIDKLKKSTNYTIQNFNYEELFV